MTTALQLATDVACAARRAKTIDRAAVEVLRVLDQHGTWFCRIVQREGISVDVPLPHPAKPKRKVKR